MKPNRWHPSALLLVLGLSLLHPAILRAGSIHDAAEKNDLAKVRDLLQKDPALIRATNDYQETPLHKAVYCADTNMVAYLLSKGADVNARCANQFTPLHLAVDEVIARFLIRNGADLKAQSSAGTPLEYAVSREDVRIINVYLEAGQELDFKSLVKLGRTNDVARLLHEQPWLAKPPNDSLSVAAQNGDLALVTLLLAHGADPNFDPGSRWRSGPCTALSHAVMRGGYDIAKLLFEHGATPEVSAYIGKMDVSLIQYTVAQSDLHFMKLVLSHGADVNLWSRWGNLTPLHVAAQMNDLERVKLLLEYKADINADPGDGVSPLFVAALRGHKDMCEFLLSHGAHLDFFSACALGKGGEVEHMLAKNPQLAAAPDKRLRREPIFFAVKGGNPEIVKRLLSAGAHVNARGPEYSESDLAVYESSSAWKENIGETPLYTAGGVSNGAAVARLLVEAGAEVDARNNSGETPLHSALEHGNEPVARVLLAAKADVNAETKYGWTALTKAIASCPGMVAPLLESSPRKKTIDGAFCAVHASPERDKIVRLLMAHGGQPDFYSACALGLTDHAARFLKENPSLARSPSADDPSRTPLYLAAENGNADIVKLLMSHGAKCEAPQGRESPLHVAAQKGHLTVVQVLLAADAAVDLPNYAGETPLHDAAKGGHLAVVKCLLDRGAPLLAADSYRTTALHVAAEKGAVDVAKFLVARGTPVDVKDKYGRTPLHRAAGSGQVAMARLLLDLEADVAARDFQDKTPLETTRVRLWYRDSELQENREKVAALLLKKESKRQ